MKTFKVLSLLLNYPQAEWVNELAMLEEVLDGERDKNGNASQKMADLFHLFRTESLLDVEQNYVSTFDRNPSHSLHLFEHIHGESKDRGMAMVNLIEEYRKHGLDMDAEELPDFVPLFLEYLSQLPDEEAINMLGETVDVLGLIGRKLKGNDSPYHSVFDVLEWISPVEAQPLPDVPIRDMEETIIQFGPSADGTDPLMVPKPQTAVVRMPQSRKAPASAAALAS
jgi:nitrate reductase molybdenum cofactor assembly chaperone NarJ/NarW